LFSPGLQVRIFDKRLISRCWQNNFDLSDLSSHAQSFCLKDLQGETKNFGKTDALSIAPRKTRDSCALLFRLMFCGNCAFDFGVVCKTSVHKKFRSNHTRLYTTKQCADYSSKISAMQTFLVEIFCLTL
jgi:hypothetical protein